MKNITVTGLGSVSSAGSKQEEIWNALTHTRPSLSPSTILDKKAFPYPFFEAPCLVNNRKKTAKDTLFLAEYALERALKSAKLTRQILQESSSVGIVMGTTAGSALHFIEDYAKVRAGTFKREEISDIDDYFHANLALELAQSLKVQGPVLTLANACTSGADAIGIGMELIRAKECEYVICGGADALSLVPHTGFSRLMIYSDEACRPFDAMRKGLNLGEAAAVLILESREHAKKRKAFPYGYILGYGSASDAYHFTAPHPEGKGLLKAIEKALESGNISKEELAFINAHGTATKENDKVEGKLFKSSFPDIPVWASKGATGHTLGAAGALEALFSLLALQKKILPQSFGFREEDPNINLVPTQENTLITKEYALSTSLGFGGGNAALVLASA